MKWTSKSIDFKILGRPDKRMLTGRKYSFRYYANLSTNKGRLVFHRIRPQIFRPIA